MISTLPQIASISDMRLHQMEVIKKAQHGPVILVERGSKPTLVCVSPEMWDTLANYIDDLECSVEAIETELAIATGKQKVERVTVETWIEIERMRERAAIST